MEQQKDQGTSQMWYMRSLPENVAAQNVVHTNQIGENV